MEHPEVSRRAFVAGAATIAAIASPVLASADTPAGTFVVSPTPPSAPGTFDTVPYTFDVAGFMAVLNQPFAHRQLVSATSYERSADALAFMSNTLRAYADPIGFNAGPKSVHAAAVFYHGTSVLMVVDDTMYAKYSLGAIIAPATSDAMTANPHASDVHALVADHGASFFVCNNALSGVAGMIAKKIAPAGTAVTRAQVVAVHADLVAHFVPGTLLVPAGVAAINAAQEAHFTLLVA
jgi:hypothetical protein